MVRFTNCKINIGLDVVARRPDGYHELVSCMLPVPWADVLEIVPAKGDECELTVLGNAVDCPAEKNLVMKAYRALQKHCSLPPVHIILQKIVPDGAGLGGGSSDAAHTLRLLNEMFGLGIDKARLARIAATIGADCPFFVYDETMMCRGIGDVMSPVVLPLSGYTVLIAKPSGVSISTREAYAGITPRYPDRPLDELLALPVEQWQGRVKNDFEPGIFRLAPQIGSLKQAMLDGGAVYASMSGSGASVYGIFADAHAADVLFASLSDDMPKKIFKIQ